MSFLQILTHLVLRILTWTYPNAYKDDLLSAFVSFSFFYHFISRWKISWVTLVFNIDLIILKDEFYIPTFLSIEHSPLLTGSG